jgi:integrase/recombinase XerD
MNSLKTALRGYLAIHRALGAKLHEAESLLQRFVEFTARAKATYITTDLALKWANQAAEGQPRARRLAAVRRFAQYCSSSEPRTMVPPRDLLPYRYHRKDPYIYSDDEIRRLLEAARQLLPAKGLRPHTYATLFALYAATGMRTREALRLDRNDVDLLQGVLTIRESKFGKSRVIPLHPSTNRALQRYAKRRDRLCSHPLDPSFFISDHPARLSIWSVHRTFITLSHRIGLRQPGDSHGPRVHDLRHRLAITTLIRWHRRGVDVERHLPELCAFLGHSEISHTYWYLTATPQLLRSTLRRVERSERRTRS